MAKKTHQDEETALPDETEAGEKVSKMEAVRRLLGDDPEMKPGEGVQAVKAQFGLDMTPANFSAYKSQILKGKAGGKGKGKVGRKAAETAPQAAPAGADPLEAAQAVKALVERYGPKTVKGLADMFADLLGG